MPIRNSGLAYCVTDATAPIYGKKSYFCIIREIYNFNYIKIQLGFLEVNLHISY